MRKLPLVVALLVVCSAARVLAAENDPKKAFEAATAEFNLGHYEKAAAMYEDIYRVTLEPVLLYNIAQAHRLGGEMEKAVFFYKGYLRAQPQAKNREEVKRRIAELDQAIEAKRRSQERPPNVPANVDTSGRTATATSEPQPAPTPSSEPQAAPPPSSTPTAPTTTTETPAATAQAATTTETTPERTPVWKKWWFWTIIGGVVVAGVVIGVVVAETAPAPSFGANLPPTGPAAQALTAAPRSASTATLLEVRF